MFKMFHYMKERWYYIVMIVALLFCPGILRPFFAGLHIKNY